MHNKSISVKCDIFKKNVQWFKNHLEFFLAPFQNKQKSKWQKVICRYKVLHELRLHLHFPKVKTKYSHCELFQTLRQKHTLVLRTRENNLSLFIINQNPEMILVSWYSKDRKRKKSLTWSNNSQCMNPSIFAISHFP